MKILTNRTLTMENNFQQTVNLKKKSTKKNKTIKKQSSEIDKIYDDREIKRELQKIALPKNNQQSENIYKKIVFILIFILIFVVIYFLFFSNKDNSLKTLEENKNNNWYSVKLLNDEIYYGQIDDIKSDPVVIQNVYYNYDQANKEENKNNNLRLVKRGKETHGPDGTMDIVRSQVVYMELLSDDSKVLQAIINYEK